MARRAFRIIADRLINQTAFQKQFLSESFSQHLRLLNLRELHARFFGGLSNPSGFAGERFSEGKGRFSPIAFQPHPASERRSYHPCAVGRIIILFTSVSAGCSIANAIARAAAAAVNSSMVGFMRS